MRGEENKTVRDGDAVQLRYIKQQYNYLLEQKFSVQDTIRAETILRRPVAALILQVQELSTQMLHLDELRTQIGRVGI